jgi:hypothetical protein
LKLAREVEDEWGMIRREKLDLASLGAGRKDGRQGGRWRGFDLDIAREVR